MMRVSQHHMPGALRITGGLQEWKNTTRLKAVGATYQLRTERREGGEGKGDIIGYFTVDMTGLAEAL